MQADRLGPYRIGKQLGRGGMGTVYAGLDDDDQPAAIKVLATSLGRDTGFRERFEAEIETLRKLKHPNIVRLFGYGEEDGVLFYAMEMVEGRSLEEDLQGGRRFHWPQVVKFGVKLCSALRHAHDRGVVHRDIKPANLLLTVDDDIKLSDFGIAKLFGATGMTSAGGILGTAEYMAPEQADGRPVGHRADLYSLGAVLYTLLARRPPFVGKSIPELLHMQRFAVPEPIRRFCADVPEEIDTLVLQLLEKDPERRVANAVLLSRRLEATARGLEWKQSQVKPPPIKADYEVEAPSNPALTGKGRRSDATQDISRSGRKSVDQLAGTQATGAGLAPSVADSNMAATAAPTNRPSVDASDLTLAPAAAGYSVAANPAEAKKSATATRFTTVAEVEEKDALLSEDGQPVISSQTVMLASALLVLGLGIWYMLQPPSADSLYAEIQESVKQTGEPLAAATEINSFLELYPADPRSREMEAYLEENDVLRLEKRFALRANRLSRVEGLSPIEADYLDAMSTASINPAEAYERLQAMSVIYEHEDSPSGDISLVQKLIQRQLQRLREPAQYYIQSRLDLIRRRLADAEAADASDPSRATQLRQGVIELYGHQPWAAAEIARARAALAAKQPATAPADEITEVSTAPAYDPRATLDR